ncbi:hypothetical protein [Azospirillum rugosum]|uniref:Uncharacterized protein n=1 Tax=Azospirillum rugosum TaxID=416170 RepID=A0ABS4SG82_9PROT|nr:hypothetical protein [Azospirillum rugosum]MBP2290977.1 hypothetical protein [Azospirillum rugosum]MDQ0524959.1 hypothetical protein [Azospirillum rugosum]
MNISDASPLASGSAQRLVPSSSSSQSLSATGTAVQASKEAGVKDSVSLSPLASSLHDESLTAFNALSSETRTQLSSLVDSGALSGEDVHNALKQRVKEARRSAYSATFRMAHNDNADLFFNENTNRGDFQNALRATTEKRAELMKKLSALDGAGQGSSADYANLSQQLVASDANPKLLRDRSGMKRYIMDPFGGVDFEDSRLNTTRKEVDAVYKLKAAGVDLSAIDRGVRALGERDAASIIAERADLPHATTVAKDREFSLNDALVQPIRVPPMKEGADMVGDRASILAANPELRRDLEKSAGISEEMSRYMKEVRVRY